MNCRSILVMLPALGSLTTTTSLAQVTPPTLIQVNSPIITINGSPGDQTDPHVDKDLVSYTDATTNQIRYYRFSTGVDLAIPQDQTTLFDVLSDVNGGRIAFSRAELDRNAVYVFDTSTASLTEIDPHAGSNRFNPALGGNTLAFVDQSSGNGDIFSYDLGANPPNPPLIVSLDPNAEQNPNVSPDGKWIVWEDCAVSISHCNVFKAIFSGGVWSVSAVANSPDPEGNPDTDGTWIVYDANRAGNATGQDIYYQPVGGGAEVQLPISGDQQNPSIKGGFIGFESRATSSSPADLFVYDIANNILYQVTATPTIDENLSDISLLDNGDIRMVWAANDGAAGDENIHATTFTPIRPTLYQICPLYDSNVAKKAGSAYPIKIQLCDANGTNLSSSSIMLHAVGVTRISTNTPTILDDTGNANPDFDFRYDSSLDGYIFNFSTKGYANGTYSLNFSAGTDPALHSALFAVK